MTHDPIRRRRLTIGSTPISRYNLRICGEKSAKQGVEPEQEVRN
jgi:hypothetical protein